MKERLQLQHKIKLIFDHKHILINIEGADIKKTIFGMIYQILQNISISIKNGSGWYFKEVLS